MRCEIEMYPGDWIEVDPHDLYDHRMVSLAEFMETDAFDLDKLNGTYWYLWDLTQPPKLLRTAEDKGCDPPIDVGKG